jgi:hypothetical protein
MVSTAHSRTLPAGSNHLVVVQTGTHFTYQQAPGDNETYRTPKVRADKSRTTECIAAER